MKVTFIYIIISFITSIILSYSTGLIDEKSYKKLIILYKQNIEFLYYHIFLILVLTFILTIFSLLFNDLILN